MKLHTMEVEETLAADSWSYMDLNLVDMDEFWADKYPFSQILKELPLDEILGSEVFDGTFDQLEPVEPKEIVHHDCMWSGKCKDKSHPGNATAAPVVSPAPVLPPEPIPTAAPVERIAAPAPTTPGRSLLIGASPTILSTPPRSISPIFSKTKITPQFKKRTTIVAHSPPISPRPDTPQSLDDEEEHPEEDAVVPGRVYEVESEEDYEEEDEGDEACDDGYDEDFRHLFSGPARNNTVACDHSYTRKNSKQARIDLPGVQTPSDSEEEIDVVSLGEKNIVVDHQKVRPAALPIKPSPSTHRFLAHAITSGAAVNSRQPPPQPRKRPRERSISPLPRHHRKRTKAAAKPRYQPSKRRPYSSTNSDSEAENIERRSIHNDMERMRRIGLKNLFDELKNEVPTIRHKERAPKVVVLREAAIFCEKLQREEREMEQLKAKQQRLLARVRQLRVEQAQRRPKNA